MYNVYLPPLKKPSKIARSVRMFWGQILPFLFVTQVLKTLTNKVGKEL